MKKKIEKFEDATIRPLDTEKLCEAVWESAKADVAKHFPKATGLMVPGKQGLAESLSGKHAVLDKEMVGTVEDEGMIEIGFYPKYEGGFSALPAGTIRFSVEELKEYAGDEVPVKEFMDDRYGYNTRIENNQREALGFFRG